MTKDADIIRYSFSASKCLDKRIKQLGWEAVHKPVSTAVNLPTHSHRSFEICYIVHGSLEWHVKGKIYQLRPGSIFITPPNEEHGGLGGVLNPCEIYWIQLALSEDKPMLNLPSKQWQSIYQKLSGLSEHAFDGKPEIRSIFQQLIAEHRHKSVMSRYAVRAAVFQLLIAVTRAIESAEEKPRLSAAARLATEFIDKHFGEDISVEDVAEAAKMSGSSLGKLFKRQFMCTPAAYIKRKRLEQACALLRAGELSVTQIAHRLGFCTSQYFATTIKKFTGYSPRDYRKIALSFSQTDQAK
jgi:AraC-like DNA-binding protein